MNPLYTNPQETWDEKECHRRAKSAPMDAFGNRPPPGLIAGESNAYPSYGQTRTWNGGRIIEGKLYQAEHVPLPKIPDSFEFATLPTWGTIIRPKQ